MKKLLVVALMLVVFCGVSLADWQTDFDAWKATDMSDWKQGLKIVAAANQTQLVLINNDAESKAFIDEGNSLKYWQQHRWMLMLIDVYKHQELTPTVRWEKNLRLSNLYKNPKYIRWGIQGYKLLQTQGKIAKDAKLISEEEYEKLLNDFLPFLSLEHRVTCLPDTVTIEMAISYVEERLAYPELTGTQSVLKYLSKANLDDTYSDADYLYLLKKILKASVQRLKEMKDETKRSALIKAIGRIKTTYKELLELE